MNSIIDYLKKIGQDPSFLSRQQLASQAGIKNYTGTAPQNLALLKTMQENQAFFQAKQPTTPTSNQKVTPAQSAINLGNYSITPEQYQSQVSNSLPNDVNKYYNELGTNSVAGIEETAGYNTDDYKNRVADIIGQYTANKEAQDDAEGRSGTWSSSARQTRLDRLNSGANRDLASQYNSTSKNLQNLYRQGEYNVGMAFRPQSVQQFNVNTPQSVAPIVGQSGSYQYNPFNFSGTQNSQKAAVQRGYANTAIKNLIQ